jgi:cyclophilin family peptidyl-prolyl cis-trans isomerase
VSRKSRNRQLAKQAARRQAERRRKVRTRHLVRSIVAGAVAFGLVAFLFVAFRGGTPSEQASGSPRPSVTATPSAQVDTQTGMVKPGTPPKQVACGAKAPKSATARKPQFSAPGRVIQNGKTYTATIVTSCGTIVVKLLTAQAPAMVNSFVFLAEQKFYDGTWFHRLDTTIDVIQGGDPLGDGTGGPGYQVPDELTGDESYGPGVMAMANSGPNTNGSQFFIVSGDKGHLLDDQGLWTIFGNVVKGMDVVRKIQNLPVVDPKLAQQGDIKSQRPTQAIYIDTITITETG